MAKNNPYQVLRSFSFRVVVDGFTSCEFQEVSGLNATIDTMAVKEGGNNDFALKLPVRIKYDNLILKRGIVQDPPLLEWINNAISLFTFKPRNVQVELLDEKSMPVVTWALADAYPVSVKVSNFNAKESALAIETLELAYLYMART